MIRWHAPHRIEAEVAQRMQQARSRREALQRRIHVARVADVGEARSRRFVRVGGLGGGRPGAASMIVDTASMIVDTDGSYRHWRGARARRVGDGCGGGGDRRCGGRAATPAEGLLQPFEAGRRAAWRDVASLLELRARRGPAAAARPSRRADGSPALDRIRRLRRSVALLGECVGRERCAASESGLCGHQRGRHGWARKRGPRRAASFASRRLPAAQHGAHRTPDRRLHGL